MKINQSITRKNYLKHLSKFWVEENMVGAFVKRKPVRVEAWKVEFSIILSKCDANYYASIRK